MIRRPAGDIFFMTQLVVIRCDGYNPAQIRSGLHLAFKTLDMNRDCQSGEKILIKPNLLSAVTPEQAVTPHPEVLRALAQNLAPMGLGLSIGDSPAFDASDKALRISGLATVAAEMDIGIADFEHQTTIDFPEGVALRRFNVAKGVADAEGIISLCKMKTHALTGMTGAVKNQLGVIVGPQKAKMHVQYPDVESFSRMLVDINRALRPRLYVMDGITALEGNGPRNGQPRFVGLLMVSRDPVLVDAFAASVMGLDPQSIETVRAGQLAGLGNGDLESAKSALFDLRDGQPASVRERVGRASDFASELMIPDFVHAQTQRSVMGRLASLGAPIVKGQIMNRPTIDKNRCTRCGICVKACPLEPPAVDRQKKNTVPEYQYTRCIRCYCCQEVCPAGAISVKKTLIGRLLRM